MKKLVVKVQLAVVMIFTTALFSQAQETNNWFFGSTTQHVGIRINFNSGSPVVSTCIPMVTEEGSSSISDASGNALFYTDGTNIWDASTDTKFNSTALLGGSSSTQSAIVMPKPGATNQWLVFTSGTNGSNGVNCYTVSGTSGAFTINSATPQNLTASGTTGEGLFVIGSTLTGTSFWVVSRAVGTTGTVFTWPVSSSGVVGAKVTSTLSGPSFTNTNYCGTIGTIKSNTCQTQLAFTYLNSDVDLVNFDASSGMVVPNTAVRINVASTNSATCPQGTNSGSYGLEFSPNDAYLYISNLDGGVVYKYDIAGASVSTLATMTGSVGLNGWGAGQLQIGPDSVIYIARPPQQGSSTPFTPSYLSTISNPSSATPTFTEQSLLLSGVQCTSNNNYVGAVYRGLPTFPKSLTSTYPVISPRDTAMCTSATAKFKYKYFAGSVSSISWDFGDPTSGGANTSTSNTPSHTFNTVGTYKVLLTLTDHCSRKWKDSINVTVSDPKIPAGTIVCNSNTSYTFTATGTDATQYPNYVWYDAATGGNVLGVGSPVNVTYASLAAAPTSVWVEIAKTATVSSSGSNSIGPTSLGFSGGNSSANTAISVLASSVTLTSFQVTLRDGASYGGNTIVTIKDASNNTVFTQTYPVAGASPSPTYTLNLGATLGKGNYTIFISGTAQYMQNSSYAVPVTNSGQLSIGASSAYITFANLQYTYTNYSIVATCTQRVKVDRKCLFVYPGDGTYCTSTDIPLSYTFEGTVSTQSWSITPGVLNTDWKYTSGNSSNPSPTIQFLTGGTYTVTLTVTDVSTAIYTKSMTFTVNTSVAVAGTVSCSSPNLVLDNPASDPNEPKYIWYANSVSPSNIMGTGTPLNYPVSIGGTMPTQVCIGLSGSTPTVTSATGKNIASSVTLSQPQLNTPYTSQALDVLANRITLKSVDIKFWSTSGSVTYTLTIKNGSGTTVFTKSTTATAPTAVTIPINTTLLQGTGYTFKVTTSPSGITMLTNNWSQATNANEVTYYDQPGGANSYSDAVANIQYDAYNYTTTTGCAIPTCLPVSCSLPITLIDFTGTGNGSKNFLNWTTAVEINNAYFEIQKSNDNTNFETIGKINGNGNSNTIHSYNYTDNNVTGTITYYRLVQYDYDGHSTTSPIISINSNSNAGISVAPNPSHDAFNVMLSDITTADLTVLDILGRIVSTTHITQGTNTVTFGSDLQNGTYVLQVKTDNQVFIQRIIKE